mmetsp:Transcript_27965/g.80251  ORF Transcript_27965/g.80251 Transcript_27965/m.80251 type:complete len:146 (+) Transcript_27965:1869-2306(+)
MSHAWASHIGRHANFVVFCALSSAIKLAASSSVCKRTKLLQEPVPVAKLTRVDSTSCGTSRIDTVPSRFIGLLPKLGGTTPIFRSKCEFEFRDHAVWFEVRVALEHGVALSLSWTALLLERTAFAVSLLDTARLPFASSGEPSSS